jgi:FlaA1/EpsC-like NDP-sugar epimerase
MTIEDAVHLVLRAANQGESGDTMILKMGDPILITDIAKKLISASGKNIEIKYTGLRPGEKIEEILIGVNEKVIETSDPQILRLKVEPWDLKKNLESWETYLN